MERICNNNEFRIKSESIYILFMGKSSRDHGKIMGDINMRKSCWKYQGIKNHMEG